MTETKTWSFTTIGTVSVLISNSITISDTGYSSNSLEWQIATASENDGLSTGLTWNSNKLGINAGSYCSDMSLNSKTDWRLPTKTELASLIDTSVSAPTIVNELRNTTESSRYKTSTVDWTIGSYGIFYVDFSDSSIGGTNRSYYNDVRCVRDWP